MATKKRTADYDRGFENGLNLQRTLDTRDIERRARDDSEVSRLLLVLDALILRGVSPEQAARTAGLVIAGSPMSAENGGRRRPEPRESSRGSLVTG